MPARPGRKIAGTGMSSNQFTFLAYRSLMPDDEQAAQATGVDLTTVKTWAAENVSFQAAYRQIFEDQVEFARTYAHQNMAKAVQTIVAALDACTGYGEPDWRIRLQAAKLLLQTGGLLQEKVDITSGGKSLRIIIDDGVEAVQALKGEMVEGEYRVQGEEREDGQEVHAAEGDVGDADASGGREDG